MTTTLQETIVRVKEGYRIISHRTGKNLGTYKTREEAEAALRRMARFREGQDRIGACRYMTIGGRRICVTGGHNHTGRLREGEKRTLYFGGAQPGRRAMKKAGGT